MPPYLFAFYLYTLFNSIASPIPLRKRFGFAHPVHGLFQAVPASTKQYNMPGGTRGGRSEAGTTDGEDYGSS